MEIGTRQITVPDVKEDMLNVYQRGVGEIHVFVSGNKIKIWLDPSPNPKDKVRERVLSFEQFWKLLQ
jgi:hypothetical protein